MHRKSVSLLASAGLCLWLSGCAGSLPDPDEAAVLAQRLVNTRPEIIERVGPIRGAGIVQASEKTEGPWLLRSIAPGRYATRRAETRWRVSGLEGIALVDVTCETRDGEWMITGWKIAQ